MSKKVIFIGTLIMLAIMALSLAACGDSAGENEYGLDADNPIHLTLWHYYNGPQKDTFDQLVGEFNATVGMEQGIIIDALNQGNIGELTTKLIDAAEGKVGAANMPSIFAAYADTAYAIDQITPMADISSYFSEEELAAYHPDFIEEGRFDDSGALKIFPIAKSFEVLMINATDWQLFADASGHSLEDLATIEGLISTAEDYYNYTLEQTGMGKALFGRDSLANFVIIGAKQLGIDILGNQQNGLTYNLDQAVMRQLWDSYYIPSIKGYFANYGSYSSDDMRTGDIISFIGSTTGSTYFPKMVVVNDIDEYEIDSLVMAAPVFADGQMVAVQQGAGLVVNAAEPAYEYAATVFLKWFTEAERNIGFCVGSGYLPVKNEALNMEQIAPALAELDEENRLIMEQTFAAAIEQVDTMDLYTVKPFANSNALRNILGDSLQNKIAEDLAILNGMPEDAAATEDDVITEDAEATEEADIDKAAITEAAAEEVAVEDEQLSYLLSDENFQAWYDGLLAEVETAAAL